MKTLSDWKKPLRFGLYGALGCFLGAIVGEGWLALTRPASSPAPPQQSVALVIDTSGSMTWGKLDEVKSAAKTFLSQHSATENRDETSRTAIVAFDSDARVVAPLGSTVQQQLGAVDSLDASAQTRIDLGLDSALSQIENAPAPRSVLLFTDGLPQDFGVDAESLAIQSAGRLRAQNVRLLAIATGDADADYLAQLTGDRNLVFWADSGNFGAAFERAGQLIYGRQLSDSGAVENSDPNAALWRIGIWTSLLGVGLALALLWGQARTLGRPLEAKLVVLGATGAIVAGGVAGALGQIVFAATSGSDAWVTLSRVLAWALLGGILARGTGCVVPNLDVRRAWQFGGIGGALAAWMFVQLSPGGDVLARGGGAIVLGFCIGLMVVLAEMVGRRAWLDVRGTGEISYQLNLGNSPLRVGSERARSEIWVPESAPQWGHFAIQNEQVVWHDAIANRPEFLTDGAQKQFANLTVTVRHRAPESSVQVLADTNHAPIFNPNAPQVLASTLTPATPTQNGNPFDQQNFTPNPPQPPQVLAGAPWRWRALQGAHGVQGLHAETVTIGRASTNSWVVQDSAISSQHAVLQWHQGHWWLRDLGSTNGTWLNGTRLIPNQAMLLNIGDVLRIGSSEWRLEA